MQLVITEEAKDSILNNFDTNIARKINDKLLYFAQNYDELVKTKNVEKLTNSNISKYRISIDIRAFFIVFYDKDTDMLVILDVVNRENAYKQRFIEKYEKQALNYKSFKYLQQSQYDKKQTNTTKPSHQPKKPTYRRR